MSLSIVIPTLDRGPVLLATVRAILELEPRCLEVIVVDQTRDHDPQTRRELSELAGQGDISWLMPERRSIPGAMNLGLLAARGEIVLFLDDDVIPSPSLLAAHLEAHRERGCEVIAGQVLQPGEEAEPLAGAAFGFRSTIAQSVTSFMGGNFSVSRATALRLRGFDESFVQVAYRFEAEFSHRAISAGARIWFEPAASIRHLRAPRGGTRTYGSHLRTVQPGHAVGEYYYLLRRRPSGFVRIFVTRPWRAVRTRHHLARPWWIPVTLCAEALGALWALALASRPPRLLAADVRPEKAA